MLFLLFFPVCFAFVWVCLDDMFSLGGLLGSLLDSSVIDLFHELISWLLLC